MAEERVGEAQPGGEAGAETRMCQMCGTASGAADSSCQSCGATLATRESLGGLVISGVTAVDPALAAYDAQPWRLTRSSPSQGMAGGTIAAAAAMGGPAGLVAIAGLAAVAATEYGAAGRDGGRPPIAIEDVGRPMEPALQMLERLQREEAEGTSKRDLQTESAPAPPNGSSDAAGAGGW